MTEQTAARQLLARAIHERYRQNQRAIKAPDDPAMRPWEELPESLRESNRQQADDIAAKLRAIGCELRPAAAGAQAAFVITEEELELLAEREHERWVAERRAAGWIAGPARDVERKITPYLVPYAILPEEVKEWDRQAVRAIPEVLAIAGFEVYRRSGGALPAQFE